MRREFNFTIEFVKQQKKKKKITLKKINIEIIVTTAMHDSIIHYFYRHRSSRAVQRCEKQHPPRFVVFIVAFIVYNNNRKCLHS